MQPLVLTSCLPCQVWGPERSGRHAVLRPGLSEGDGARPAQQQQPGPILLHSAGRGSHRVHPLWGGGRRRQRHTAARRTPQGSPGSSKSIEGAGLTLKTLKWHVLASLRLHQFASRDFFVSNTTHEGMCLKCLYILQRS